LNAATVLQECTVANSDTPQQLCEPVTDS
jgi:hypothetical protein